METRFKIFKPGTVLALLLVAVIGAAGHLYFKHRQAIRHENAGQELSAIADMKVRQITDWRAGELAEGAEVVNSPFFKEAAAQWLAKPQPELAGKILQHFGSLQTRDQFKKALLLSPDGAMLLGLNPKSTTLGEEETHSLRLALRTGRPVLTDLHIDDNPAPHVDVFAPLFSGNGTATNPIAAVMLERDLSEYIYPLIQWWPTPSKSAETLLVRRDQRDGDAAYFLNDVRFSNNSALLMRIPLSQTNTPAVMAVLGRQGVVEGSDYRGAKVLAVLRSVPDSPWFLVAKEDLAELDAPLRREAWMIAGIAGLLMMAVLLGSFLFERQRRLNDVREAAKALGASQALYHSLVEYVPAGVFRKDREGRYVFVNSQYCRLKGRKSEEILGRTAGELALYESTLADHSPSEMKLQHALALQGADHHELILRTGEIIRQEEVYPQPEGTTQYFQAIKSPVFGYNKDIIGTQGILFDITERKRAEEQLRMLSRAVEQSPASIVITDPKGDIEYVNTKFCAVTGYTAAEVHGKNPRVLKSGEMPVEGYRQLWATILAGREWQGEFHNKKKNGELYWEYARILPIVDEAGRVTHFLAVKEDITERKLVEAALRESEERFRTVAQTASDGIISADGQGMIVLWNPAAEIIFGYPAADAVGQSLTLIMPERFREAHQAGLDRMVATGESKLTGKTVELTGRRKDGTEFPVEMSLSPWKTEKRWFVTSIIRDISERKKIEAEREFLIKNLETALAEVNTLSGIIPICAGCKKIRDDQGYWGQVESYISKHSLARFSHGLCPECSQKYFPGVVADENE